MTQLSVRLELGFDLVGVLAEPSQAMAEMHAIRRQRANQHVEYIGTVRLILWETEITFDLVPSGVRNNVRPSSQRCYRLAS